MDILWLHGQISLDIGVQEVRVSRVDVEGVKLVRNPAEPANVGQLPNVSTL